MLYKKFLGMHLKTSFEYRLNLVFITIAQFFTCVSEFLSIIILFTQFESVGYWGFYETALMFGIVTTVFSSTECFARGFDEFSSLIKTGEFDRMLVRPVGLCHQIFCSKIEFCKLSRVLLGIVVSIIAVFNLAVKWTVLKVLVLISTYFCGAFIMLGLFMLGAGISVFTVENLEFFNVFTYGGRELSYYPINIYNKWLARFFTFVIPFACFNYLPVSYLLGYDFVSPVLCALAPLLGTMFVIPCYLIFKACLKKYQSTGT